MLKKKLKTKLVLKADSSVEFDGWLRTIKNISIKVDDLEEVLYESSVKKYRYENIEVNDTENIEHNECEATKIVGKIPVPTPRNRTSSKDNSSNSEKEDEQQVQSMTMSINKINDDKNKSQMKVRKNISNLIQFILLYFLL